mmetsp:Transcript_123791/g.214612  ORF Transcript_123791/g.214612 Transcript_123791/m.214612 type:complete len:365 (+) Transcript_123791:130-1224(+)
MYSQRVLKYGSLSVMLVGYTLDSVLVKRATYAAYYPSALTVLAAVLGAVVYPVIVVGAFASGKVTWAQVRVPFRDLWMPLVVSAGFSLHHVLLNVAAGKAVVPGIWILVLGKSIVPMSMLLNMFSRTMGLRYDLRHWLGALLLLGGILLTLGQDLAKSAHVAKGLASHIGNMLLIILAQLPLAASFTFIEITLKGVLRDIFTVAFWMWVCIFQVAASLIMLPLSAGLSGSFREMWPNLGEGMLCYVAGQTPEDAPAGTDCASACGSWWVAILFTFAMNLAMPLSTRYGGAALMWFVRGLAVPLTGMLFASRFLMGLHAKNLSLAQTLGLGVVAAGVLVFNSREPHPRESCGDTAGILGSCNTDS